MFDIPIKQAMERRKVLKTAPDTPILKVAKLMAKRNAGAAMVLVEDRLVGIVTERDIVFRVVAPRRDPTTTLVSEVMTPNPRTIGPNQPLGQALLIMHDNGFRHLPVLESGRLVGVVSARSAMDPDLEEFSVEANRRERYSVAQ